MRLLLDERILADGSHARTWAERDGEHVIIRDDEGDLAATISIAGLDRVIGRIGRPLDSSVELTGECLELANGFRLRRLRFHAAVDATGRDYLVWERVGEEPLAAIATSVAMMLRFIALRLDPQKSEGPQA
ncbi:MAG TPA: hypothetical protein VH143_22045 [Kofleriaceae bacterium]|nr:hypothetical protein [Kofleriaceae bacterium]